MSFAAFDTTTWYHMRYHEASEDVTGFGTEDAIHAVDLLMIADLSKAERLAKVAIGILRMAMDLKKEDEKN